MNRCTRAAIRISYLLVLFGFPAGARGQQATAPSPRAETTAKNLFSIPFYLSPNAPLPAEVHLFVSGDSGRTWILYQRRQPQQSKFNFQAGQDGEYWFAVRTSEDREPPNSNTRPEKVVIVDRVNPELSLEIEVGPAGELVASYRGEDANLEPNSLRLEYRASDADPWQPVSVNRTPPATPQDRQTVQGQTSWVLPATIARVQARAEVTDRAGNRREVLKELDVGRPATASVPSDIAESVPRWRQQVRATPPNTPAEASRLPWLESTAERPDVGPVVTEARQGWRTTGTDSRSPSILTAEPPVPSTLTETMQRTFPERDEFARPALPPQDRVSAAPTLDPGPPASFVPTAVVETPRPLIPERAATAEPQLDSQSTALRSGTEFPRAVPPADDYAPPVANRIGPAEPPQRPDVQMTNSRRFNLDYDVARSGPQGVARVELWITYDNGNTWQAYGLDRDLQSPFLVEMDREGIFGFRLLIHNQDGSAARPPQPGDEADLWIGLDWTPPRARFLKAEVISAPSTQTVLLQWQAEDDYLTERSIRLSYAPSPNGPWSVIANNLANTGSFAWGPTQPLPARTYLQLEVSDRAGNITTEQLAEPIGSGAGGPKGIIRGIRPVDDGPAAAATR